MTISDCKILDLPKIFDVRGNLSFVEEKHIPFKIQRSYWIYDVPGGEIRGGHSYKENEEFIISLSGSFDVILDDGKSKRNFQLNRSYYGLYVPRGIWRHMENFSTNSLALVLASTLYSEKDYIRDYNDFLKYSEKENNSKKSSEPLFPLYVNGNGTKNTVDDCYIINLDKNHRIKGNITVIENNRKNIPFDVKRVYYLYDVPGGEARGGHGHIELSQLIVATSGSFDVILNDGNTKRVFTLNRPYNGLYVAPGMWRELDNFSSGSSCLVLASHEYDEKDYIRNYNDFIKFKRL